MSGGYGIPGPLQAELIAEDNTVVAGRAIADLQDCVTFHVPAGVKVVGWRVYAGGSGFASGWTPPYQVATGMFPAQQFPTGGSIRLQLTVPMFQVQAMPTFTPYDPVAFLPPTPPTPPTTPEPERPGPSFRTGAAAPVVVSPPRELEDRS